MFVMWGIVAVMEHRSQFLLLYNCFLESCVVTSYKNILIRDECVIYAAKRNSACNEYLL